MIRRVTTMPTADTRTPLGDVRRRLPKKEQSPADVRRGRIWSGSKEERREGGLILLDHVGVFLYQFDACICVEKVNSVCQHSHYISTSRTISGPCRSSRAISRASALPPKSPLNSANAASSIALFLSAKTLAGRLLFVSTFRSSSVSSVIAATQSSIDSLSSTISSSFMGLLNPCNIPQYGAVLADGFLNTFVLMILSFYGFRVQRYE